MVWSNKAPIWANYRLWTSFWDKFLRFMEHVAYWFMDAPCHHVAELSMSIFSTKQSAVTSPWHLSLSASSSRPPRLFFSVMLPHVEMLRMLHSSSSVLHHVCPSSVHIMKCEFFASSLKNSCPRFPHRWDLTVGYRVMLLVLVSFKLLVQVWRILSPSYCSSLRLLLFLRIMDYTVNISQLLLAFKCLPWKLLLPLI